MRILVAETDWALMALAQDMMQAGFLISRANDFADLTLHLEISRQNIVLLPTDLPDQKLINALTIIRAISPTIVIAIVADRELSVPEASLLNAGADFLLPATCDPSELAGRLRCAALRWGGFGHSTLAQGLLRLDVMAQRGWINDTPLRLPRLQYELMETVMLARGDYVPRDAIMLQLYGLETAPEDRVLNVYLSLLRKQLSRGPNAGVALQSRSGFGVRLCETANADRPAHVSG